jgi:hypothetical protein
LIEIYSLKEITDPELSKASRIVYRAGRVMIIGTGFLVYADCDSIKLRSFGSFFGTSIFLNLNVVDMDTKELGAVVQ